MVGAGVRQVLGPPLGQAHAVTEAPPVEDHDGHTRLGAGHRRRDDERREGDE